MIDSFILLVSRLHILAFPFVSLDHPTVFPLLAVISTLGRHLIGAPNPKDALLFFLLWQVSISGEGSALLFVADDLIRKIFHHRLVRELEFSLKISSPPNYHGLEKADDHRQWDHL